MAAMFVHRMVSDKIVWPNTPKRSAKSVHLSKVDLMFEEHIGIGSVPFWDRILCVCTPQSGRLSQVYTRTSSYKWALSNSLLRSWSQTNCIWILAPCSIRWFSSLPARFGMYFRNTVFFTGFLSEICTSLIRDSTIFFIVFQHGSSVCLWWGRQASSLPS